MSKVFSINITFQDQPYTVLVCLREQTHDMLYVVRYIDLELQKIMGREQLVFSLHEGLKEPKVLPSDIALELLMCTTNGLSEHLTAEV